MKKVILILATVFAFGVYAQKPSPFKAKTADEAKIKSYLDFPAEGRNAKNGSGYSANVELINPKPKKVALISFYVYDPGTGNTSGGAMAGSATTSAWRTSESVAQTQVDGFYAQSIDQMKSKFKEYNIDLLTPDQFLTSEEMKDLYYGFEQESGKKEKTSTKMIGKLGTVVDISTLKICPTDKGYRPFFVANEAITKSVSVNFMNAGIMGANRKMTSSLGYELCKGLGVDAVVVCYIVTRKIKKNKEDYAVNAVNLFMFGPNPVSSGADDKNRGQFYCGTRYFASTPLLFQGEKIGTSYDNMGIVTKALSNRLCNYVINKAKK